MEKSKVQTIFRKIYCLWDHDAGTLESVSQNFKRRFHFLFLVSVAVDKLTARWNWVDEA